MEEARKSPKRSTPVDERLLREESALGARVATDDVCPHCGGFGYRKMLVSDIPRFNLSYDELAYFEAGIVFNIPCEYCEPERTRRLMEKYQDKSGLTTEERKYRLQDVIVNDKTPGTLEMKTACEEMLRQEAFMLTIQGSSGNAKSVALIAVTNEFLCKGIPALYTTLSSALDWIKAAFDGPGRRKNLPEEDTAFDRINLLFNVRVLALDEMQDAYGTDWAVSILVSLINERYRRSLSAVPCFTIVATNKPVKELPTQMLSRLKDGRNRISGNPIIINNDKDLRADMKR
jgi:DNA replication protein DnaC